MKKYLLLLPLLILVGCTTDPVYVKIPINACPAPIKLERPNLEIYKLTEEDKKDPGKVAKAYKATIIQLQGHISNLESIIDQYNEAAKDVEKRLDVMKKERPELFSN